MLAAEAATAGGRALSFGRGAALRRRIARL